MLDDAYQDAIDAAVLREMGESLLFEPLDDVAERMGLTIVELRASMMRLALRHPHKEHHYGGTA